MNRTPQEVSAALQDKLALPFLFGPTKPSILMPSIFGDARPVMNAPTEPNPIRKALTTAALTTLFPTWSAQQQIAKNKEAVNTTIKSVENVSSGIGSGFRWGIIFLFAILALYIVNSLRGLAHD